MPPFADPRQATQKYFSERDWANAAAAAEQALAQPMEPGKDRVLYLMLCLSLRALGRLEDARAAFKRGTPSLSVIQSAQHLDYALMAAIAGDDLQSVKSLFHHKNPGSRCVGMPIACSSTTTLDEWCRAQNLTLARLEAPRTITVEQKPQGVGTLNYVAEGFTYARIPNAEFLCGWDFVVTPTGKVISDSSYMRLETAINAFFPHIFVREIGIVAHPWTDQIIEMDCDALFLSAPERFHYGHWLIDFLPRLRAIEGTDTKVMITTDLPQKHSDLLTAMGVGPNRRVICELGKRYRFRNLIVARPGSYLLPNPNTIDFLRQRLGRRAAAASAPRQRYFFERGAGTRLPANREEVNATLREFGFRHIDLSTLPLAEEHHLLAEADIIVAAYGTELLAAFGVPAGADVIELIWDTKEDIATAPICHFLGIHHEFLVCAKAPQTVKKNYSKDCDMIVDCGELRQRITAALGRKNR